MFADLTDQQLHPSPQRNGNIQSLYAAHWGRMGVFIVHTLNTFSLKGHFTKLDKDAKILKPSDLDQSGEKKEVEILF